MATTTVSRWPALEQDGAGRPPGSGGRGGNGGDDPGAGEPERDPRPLDNSRLAMLCVLIVSSMLFAALIGAFLVLKTASRTWPPAGSPPLPGLLRWSTLVLLASSVTLALAHGALHRARLAWMRPALALTSGLGLAFLVLQGMSWLKLVRLGLLPRTNNFGGQFYLISGAHGLHAVVGVGLLLWVTAGAWRAGAARLLRRRLALTAMLWHFLDAVWLALYFGVLR